MIPELGHGATRKAIHRNLNSVRGSIDICSACLSGFTSDRNVVRDRFVIEDGAFITLGQWQAATGQDGNSILAAPGAVFQDAANDDYRLGPASPAVDAGETRADVPADIAGTTRPRGAGFDIGAYEFSDLIFADGFD